MQQRIKLDPFAYLLIGAVLAIQIYTSFVQANGVDEILAASDAAYRDAVFEDRDSKGVMHQVFRQNEVDRELLKTILRTCAR